MSEAGADPEVTPAPRMAWKIVFLALVVFALAAGTRAITRSNAAPLAHPALADRVVQTVAPAAAPRLTTVALPVLRSAPRPARKVRPAPSRIVYAPTPTATATPTSTSTPFATSAPTVAPAPPPPPAPTPVRTARPAPTPAPTFDYNGTFNTSH